MTSRSVFVVALLALWCCKDEPNDEPEPARRSRLDEHGRVVLTAQERSVVGLETAPVESGELTTASLRFGKLSAPAQDDALVAAPVTGRLIAASATLGAQVAAGDPLLALEPLVDTASHAALQAQARELQGQIKGAQAQIEAANANLRRVTTLASSGLANAADQAQAQAALATEQARAESLAHASDELRRATSGRIELRAPVSGSVVMLPVKSGVLVEQGAVLARIVRSGARWIDLAVPPEDAVGTAYLVQGSSGKVPATLLARGGVAEADGTRRDRLELNAASAAGFLPGATVSVDVLHTTTGFIVPLRAIVRRGHDALVFVEAEAGRFEPRATAVAASDDSRAALASGVSAGEHVVIQGAASLLGELGPEVLGSKREESR